jgi:hypothetical protein
MEKKGSEFLEVAQHRKMHPLFEPVMAQVTDELERKLNMTTTNLMFADDESQI